MTDNQKSAKVSGCYMECRDGVRTWWSVYFRENDGGRGLSRRPKQKNDCTVRALALALDMTYDAAYDMLKEAGRECSRGFHFVQWAKDHPRLRWHVFQAIKGESRMTAAKFCERYPQGRWIVRTAKHIFTMVDGVVLDTHPPDPERCVYGAWEVQTW